jgi:hypothetical protein
MNRSVTFWIFVTVAVGENFVMSIDIKVSVHSPTHEMMPPLYLFSDDASASMHDVVHVG